MLSKQDREQYFQKVLAQERAMVHKMQEILRGLKDAELKGSIEDILKDKTRHGSFAVLLYGILEGVSQEESHAYVFIRRLLDSILSREGQEKRRYIREPVLGVVRMRDQETGKEYQVKCLDVSSGGTGIESEKTVPPGRPYQLTIEFYKYSTPMHRTGKLVWMKEIIPGTFLGGVQFAGV